MVIDFLKSLVAGKADQARLYLSEEFGIHDGLGAEAYVTHEIGAFKELLLDQERDAVIEVDRLDKTVAVTLVGPEGLIYAARMSVDDQGLVKGNQYQIEYVPKFHIESSGEVSRGLALRSPLVGVRSAALLSIEPKPIRSGHGSFEFRGSKAAGEFASLRFKLDADDLFAKDVTMRIALEDGQRFTETVRFPDSGDFGEWQEQLFVAIKGNRVEILDAKSRPWQVDVELKDYTNYTYFRPEKDFAKKFDAPVKRVVVTDALDNEWAWTVEA